MIDNDLKARDYVSAANRLDTISARLEQPACDMEADVMVLSVLETQFSVEAEKLKQDVSTAWTEYVNWQVLDEHAVTSPAAAATSVQLRVTCTENSQGVLNSITQALYNIGLLHNKLEMFSDRLFEHILNPLMLIADKSVEQHNESGGKAVLVVARASGQAPPTQPLCPQTVFERCTSVLMFISEKLFNFDIQTGDANDKRKPMMALLGDVMAMRFQDALIDNCLAHAIPDSQAGLEEFSDVITATQAFQRTLVDMHVMDITNTRLFDFVNDVDVHFANKKCQEILTRARQLMTSELFNTVKVSSDCAFGELQALDAGTTKKEKGKDPLSLPANMKLNANIFKMPTCCIRSVHAAALNLVVIVTIDSYYNLCTLFCSMHAQAVVELAYETLAEATSTSPQCALQMFYATRNVFELYCSVVPAYHKDSLEKLPQLSGKFR